MLVSGSAAHSAGTTPLVGDALFAVAAALAALYFVHIERYRISALAGTAVVMVVSGLIVVPGYLLFFKSNIPTAGVGNLAIQVAFQGAVMPLSYVALHHAALLLGGTRVTIIMASVPLLTLLGERWLAGDTVSRLEGAAITLVSLGVLVGGVVAHRSRDEETLSPRLSRTG
jgi:drug/metabolite transporter (DMT)-like permease